MRVRIRVGVRVRARVGVNVRARIGVNVRARVGANVRARARARVWPLDHLDGRVEVAALRLQEDEDAPHRRVDRERLARAALDGGAGGGVEARAPARGEHPLAVRAR